MATMVAAAPGFVSIEFIPVLRSKAEWQMVLQFCDLHRLGEWRASPERAVLYQELSALLDDGAASEEEAADFHAQGSVTEVILTRVRTGLETAFREWSARIQRAQAEFPGYRGTYLQAPSREQPAWTTLVRFATTGQLDDWLASPQRRRLIDESTALVQSWSSRRLAGAFAGWFPPEESRMTPASWKQSMVVLLMLFPIVMVELRFLLPRAARARSGPRHLSRQCDQRMALVLADDADRQPRARLVAAAQTGRGTADHPARDRPAPRPVHG